MKMGWVVVIEKHFDHDAEKATDLRHALALAVTLGKCLAVSYLSL